MMDGLMYFNNDCIKIRYDIIEKADAHIYKENEVFDYYFTIFDLQKGEKVKQETPLDSYRDHRLAYILMNKERFGTSKIKYVPYLHERRIYLNRQKLNTSYFYTSIETDTSTLNFDDQEINKLKNKPKTKSQVDAYKKKQEKKLSDKIVEA